jgi:iron complex transport system substrate-binding protein
MVRANTVHTWRWLWLAGVLCLPGISAALTLQDDDQRVIQLPGPARRIVSLAPGATAMLFEAGAGDRVVGTSAYSNEPEAAKKIERIGDAQSVDLERVLALHPDVVVVWSTGTSSLQLARLQQVGLTIYHHHVARLEQLPDSLRRLGVLAGTDAQAQAAAARLAARIEQIGEQYPPSGDRVFIQIWDRPLYTVGRDEILTDIVRRCGFHSAYEDLSGASPAVTVESVLARDPEVILALAEDAKVSQRWLAQWRGYGSMQAQRSGRMLGWSDARLTAFGPGMVDAAANLCAALSRLNQASRLDEPR